MYALISWFSSAQLTINQARRVAVSSAENYRENGAQEIYAGELRLMSVTMFVQ